MFELENENLRDRIRDLNKEIM